jgi:hypothetical protein
LCDDAVTEAHKSAHHPTAHSAAADRWKHDGVRVIPDDQLDANVPSTPGMDRKAAINPTACVPARPTKSINRP